MANTTNSPYLEDHTSIAAMEQGSQVTKILVAGSGAVGKTTLVKVMKEGKSLESLNSPLEYSRTPFIEIETIGVESIGGTGSKGTFLLVDVAGQLDLPLHALRDLSRLALGGVELVILVFSAENLQSLLYLKNWISTIKTQYQERPGKSLQFLLLMNKCDLDRCVDHHLVAGLMEAEPLIAGYLELSCKTGEGIKELQSWLVANVT